MSVVLKAPLTGRFVSIEEVPDPVFAEKMMGEGIAIEPSVGEVRAPVDGTVAILFPTGHAVGIATADGVEVLIHIGLESSTLDGVFEKLVSEGATVKAGDPLIRFDLEALRAKANASITPVVLTTVPDGWSVTAAETGRDVTAGVDEILTLQP